MNNQAQATGKSLPRRSNSSQSQSRLRRDTFNKYQSSGYSNPSKSQSNYQGSRSKNFFFSTASPEGTSARLSECKVSWRTLTSDPQILSIVSGYKMSFLKAPFQKSPPFTQASGQEALLNIPGGERVIAKRGHTEDPCYHRRLLQPPVSCTQKGRIYASGDRLEFFEQVHCKRAFPDGKPQLPKNVLLPGDFVTNIDLKDTYLSVPVHKSSRKFLCFIWKGTCYQFKALPFGLCSAPRIFTKVLKPVAAFLRRKAIRVLIIIYVDNFLLLASTLEEAVKNTQLVVTLLQSLGFIINLKKSLLIPTQVITFLGFQIDPICMIISLPAEKANKILDCCRRLLVSQSITLRNLASLLGLLEFETSHLASPTSLSSLTVRSDKGPTNEPGVLHTTL